MKKLIAMLMAMSMMLTLFAGCGNTAAPPPSEPAPEPEPVSVSEPEPPTTVEGVVKEASLSKIIVTLADGTDLALDTTGITDMKVNLGDEVKVEYTGAPGSAVAGKMEVTKAAPVSVDVTGVVKEVSASMLLLTLEDESELVLLTKDIEGLEVKVGDKVSAKYVKNDTGAMASEVKVTEAAVPEENTDNNGSAASASSQSAAPANPASSSAGGSSSTPAPNKNSSSGSSKGNSGGIDLGGYVDWVLKNGEYLGDSNDNNGNSDDEDDTTSSNPSKPAESQPEESEPEPEPDEDAGDVYEAIRLINAERSKAGLAELTIDDDLMAAAAVRAQEITDVRGHTRPDGSDFSSVFGEFGISCSKYKENCISGNVTSTADSAVKLWMDSSAHKAAILNENVTRIGLGFYQASGANYKYGWTMLATN